ncbi:MAG: hypothetical protein PHX83_06665 [Acidobacteriia bacterium]|nr:hypothetical protein [Terriglobia bacterium]
MGGAKLNPADRRAAIRARQVALFKAICAIVREERQPPTMLMLKARTGYGKCIVIADLAVLIRRGTVKRITNLYGKGSPGYSWVPTSRRLAHGIGFCSTEGCDADPELVVAGHALCAQCSRGPVDAARGGGQFRSEADEDRTGREMVASGYSASCYAGGWEPSDGEKEPRAPTLPRSKYPRSKPGIPGLSLPTMAPSEVEAEFG